MKKLVLSTLLVLASVIGVSAFDWKVSSTIIDSLNKKITNDPVVLEQAQEFADQAVPDSDTQRFRVIRIRALIRFQKAAGNITFDDQKKFIDDQISELKFDGEVKAKDYLDCLYIWWYRGWDNEVYSLMKTLEGHEKWHDAGHVCEQLKKYEEAYNYYVSSATFPDRAVNVAATRLNDPARAFAAAQLILERSYSVNAVSPIIAKTVSHLVGNPAIPAEEMKTFLTNVNRKYSSKLIEDDAAWRPVITMIRTMLETY